MKTVHLFRGRAVRADVTYAVTTKDNVSGLCLNLSSVLTGSELPSRILVRSEGSTAGTANYQLQQLVELARIYEISVTVLVARSAGIRLARNELIQHCSTPLLWMGDDDVLFHHDALSAFQAALAVSVGERSWGYLAGSKVDVVNSRGYADWDLRTRSPSELMAARPSQNHLWDLRTCWSLACLMSCRLDTGNVLLNLPFLSKHGISFTPPELGESVPAAGAEDTAFALACAAKKVNGWFCPSSLAWHLEKEQLRFNAVPMRQEAERLMADRFKI